MVQIISRFVKRRKSHLQQFKQLFRQGFSITDVHQKERGSVVVLVTLALTALLGFCALVTDVGLIYAQKAHLQNSVDAAALAGVQELPNDLSQAEQKARDYASKNGVSAVTVTFEANNAKIIVQATQQVPTYFARIWGINEAQISVSAKALMVPPTGLYGAVPLSVLDENKLVYGEPYVLKEGGGSGNTGWYGVLALSGNGASSYEEDLGNGYQGTLSVGQIVEVKNGNMSGPTTKGIAARLAQDTRVPRNTFAEHDRNAPEIMYIPIVTPYGHKEMKIVGFAAFFLDGVPGNGNDSIITGRFLQKITSNGHNNASLSDLLQTEYDMAHGGASTDFGLYTPKLVQN